MNTAYKTRAAWMIEALEYGMDVQDDRYCIEQRQMWAKMGAKASRAASAPAGADCLTRK